MPRTKPEPEMTQKIDVKLPTGTHNEVLNSEPHREMVAVWNSLAVQDQELVLNTYAVGFHSVAEVVPIIAFADVARAAFSLCSAADIARGVFDPVEFGKSCERIAVEQIERYRLAREKAGSA